MTEPDAVDVSTASVEASEPEDSRIPETEDVSAASLEASAAVTTVKTNSPEIGPDEIGSPEMAPMKGGVAIGLA